MDVIYTMGDSYTYSAIFHYSLDQKYSVKYLNIPFFHVNISSFTFHTDQHAHNVYLHLLAEGGIVLFGLFVLMYYTLINQLWKVYKYAIDGDKGLSIGTLYAIACVAIASLFGNNLL